jgi:hypothetical protein
MSTKLEWRTVHTTSDEGGSPISGVAFLPTAGLYVLKRNQSTYAIDIFAANDRYQLTRTVELKRIRQCTDMASCSYSGRLYVAADVVNIYVLSVDGEITDQWSAVDEPGGLATTADHDLLVTCFKDGKLKVFTPTGQLRTEIRLQVGVDGPLHAVEVSSELMAVSHGTLGHRINRVCIVTKEDGRIEKKFGGLRKAMSLSSPLPLIDEVQQLSVPCHLAFDGDNELLFVADSNRNRIVALNLNCDVVGFYRVSDAADGEIGEHDADDDVSLEPIRLSVDPPTRRLFVAVNVCRDKKYTTGFVKVLQYEVNPITQ